ncbi:MAG: pentapeptide repeat-containing protein [Nostoc sp.]|uniref:pentapeptide repeat-containing protein n=1 Tax=Nostoc sp. TaxID=1180 RepID=UPI002FFBEEE2
MEDPSPGRKNRKITYIASPEGKNKAERALRRLGFESKLNFAKSQLLARSTVTKFFQGEPIQLDSFKRICEALKLNWMEIAGLTEKQPNQLPISSPDSEELVEQVQLERRQVTVIDKQSKEIKVVIILKGDINSVQNWNMIQSAVQQYSGDTVEIIDFKEGSIRLFVEGSPEDIERLASLMNSGELKTVAGFPVEDVQVLSESSNDESIESSKKWRLVREIVSQQVKRRHLSGVDLSDADLSGVNLSGADLSGADFSGADLGDARLMSANLSNADLSDADLKRAFLSYANLRDADLNRAFLSDAYLIDANLMSADLSDANLSRADLSRADLSGANLSRADLSGANLSAVNLISANLSGSYLRNARLMSADLMSANLRDADLSGVNLSLADLRGADLSSADLSSVNLRSVNLSLANLMSADLRGVNLMSADLRGTKLSGALLSGANLSGADLSGALLSDANLEDTIVTNSLFIDSKGLVEDTKRDLERRGAIFGDRPPVLSPR